jgi:hypothetical protein
VYSGTVSRVESGRSSAPCHASTDMGAARAFAGGQAPANPLNLYTDIPDRPTA